MAKDLPALALLSVPILGWILVFETLDLGAAFAILALMITPFFIFLAGLPGTIRRGQMNGDEAGPGARVRGTKEDR